MNTFPPSLKFSPILILTVVSVAKPTFQLEHIFPPFLTGSCRNGGKPFDHPLSLTFFYKAKQNLFFPNQNLIKNGSFTENIACQKQVSPMLMSHVTQRSPCSKDISVYARYTSIFLHLQNRWCIILSTVLLLCILGFDILLCDVHFFISFQLV